MNSERRAKVAQVKEIAEQIATSKALIIAEYAGLKVKELEEIRIALSASSVDIKVYKNRLFKIASKEANLSFDSYLDGPNIYAFGKDDEIAPAKILTNFAKTYKALKLKSGLYEGKVIDAQEIAAIASLPSLEEARGMLAMSLLAPLRYLAIGLDLLIKNNKLEIGTNTSETNEIEASTAKIKTDTSKKAEAEATSSATTTNTSEAVETKASAQEATIQNNTKKETETKS